MLYRALKQGHVFLLQPWHSVLGHPMTRRMSAPALAGMRPREFASMTLQGLASVLTRAGAVVSCGRNSRDVLCTNLSRAHPIPVLRSGHRLYIPMPLNPNPLSVTQPTRKL